MNRVQEHRGPNDEGSIHYGGLGLGMTRLSIIGVENGKQPICNEDGSVALVMNGEIYNHAILRTELEDQGHRFATSSDAEVVVHLYEEMGLECIARLRGMFAFALYDAKRSSLHLARDRMGQKPLYYAAGEESVVFASEMKAIHASGLVEKHLELDSLLSYLAYGYVVGQSTMFQGIRKLPPGCVFTFNPAGTTLWRYWDYPFPDSCRLEQSAAAARLRELLEDAVRIRLMSEVPLGAFLSGGIDSSLVVGMMASLMSEPVQTFTVGFEDSSLDELHYARQTAEHFGTTHHEVLVPGCSEDLIRRMNWHQDEPAGDPAALPTLCLAEFAGRHISVALTGEGADEVFAGYHHHQLCRRLDVFEAEHPRVASLVSWMGQHEGAWGRAFLPRARKAAWIASLPMPARARAWSSAFTDDELARIVNPGILERRPPRLLEDDQGRTGYRSNGCLSACLFFDTRFTLADHLLMKVDKMTMAASLEARSPLLDQAVVEFAMSLPLDMRISERGSKLVLREAVRDLVPQKILDRPKHGFDIPLQRWLLKDLRVLAESCLLGDDAPTARYLRAGEIRALWRRLTPATNTRQAVQAWRILNFAVWHDLHWPEAASPGC